MSTRVKTLFAFTLCLALACGFLHLFLPDLGLSYQRLHIFLFNLCAGGTLLLIHADPARALLPRPLAYFGLALAYAVAAFLKLYPLVLVLSVPLWLLVESARVQRFSLLPKNFFQVVPTSDKFLHASLLCLSIGIPLASLVIVNEQYAHWMHREKLTMDVFFLGYSFPLSLLTFSVMFSSLRPPKTMLQYWLRESCFWGITTGVITFFYFIIFELKIPEIIISNVLFSAVILTYIIFAKSAPPSQQKSFLSSGMFLLFATSLTGIFFLFQYIFPSLAAYKEALLVIHGTVALYGWNLSGLFIVVNWDDFPVFKSTKPLIALHWLVALLLVPVGKYYAPIAVIGLGLYVFLIWSVFFGKTRPAHQKG